MKKAYLLGAALAATAVSSQAHAALFVGSVTDVQFRDHDLGLVINASPLDFGQFTLTHVGDVFEAKVLNVGTGEGSVEADDLKKYDINTTFGFTSPSDASGLVSGKTFGFFNLFGSKKDPCSLLAGQGGCGYVDFASIPTLSFANGAKLSIELLDNSFRTPGNADITARFTLLSAVPEPSTWAMMVLGVGFAGAAMRRRRATVSVRYA
jgi:hypothetical protein